jgi:hypothetical protein
MVDTAVMMNASFDKRMNMIRQRLDNFQNAGLTCKDVDDDHYFTNKETNKECRIRHSFLESYFKDMDVPLALRYFLIDLLRWVPEISPEQIIKEVQSISDVKGLPGTYCRNNWQCDCGSTVFEITGSGARNSSGRPMCNDWRDYEFCSTCGQVWSDQLVRLHRTEENPYLFGV